MESGKNADDRLESTVEYSEQELIAKLGGTPYTLAQSAEWPKSFAFLRHMRTVDNFQHAIWGLAENAKIEDRDVCGAIESFMRYIPNALNDWIHQLQFDQLTSHKFSPIAKLICNHRINAAEILLDAGMDPDFPCDSKGRTAVQGCIAGGNSNISGFKMLLDRGASPRGERNRTLCQGNSAICLERPVFCIWKTFAQNSTLPMETQEQLFIELVSADVSIEEIDTSGSNIAHALCTVGSLESINDLISLRGDSAKKVFSVARRTDGFFPIHVAASFGHSHLIPTLITLGNRPSTAIDDSYTKRNAYSGQDLGPSTAFFLALINGRSSKTAMNIFKQLDAKVIANTVHLDSGTTPLHWCVWHQSKNMKDNDDHINLALALIANGCSVSKRDKGGRLPIHLACFGGHLDMLSILASTDQLINDRLAMASQYFPSKMSRKPSKIVSETVITSTAEIMVISDNEDNETKQNELPIQAGLKSTFNAESSINKIDGVTPLLCAIMSRDAKCVRALLGLAGIRKFQISCEPRHTLITAFPPSSPVVSHFQCFAAEDKTRISSVASVAVIAKDFCNKLKTADPKSTSRSEPHSDAIEIHSPLSYAIVTAQFDIVELLLDGMSKNEPIVYQELIQSRFRCKDDFFLVLMSSIVKAAKLSLLPTHFQNLLPFLGETIEMQLASISDIGSQDVTNEFALSLDDAAANKMLSGVFKLTALPASSDGMPLLANSVTENRLSYIHMTCILGYSQCCEVLMKANPRQNYSLKTPFGLISPLHLSVLYKRLACFNCLIKLSPNNVLLDSLQEPLLNHLRPIHLALLSGNISIVSDLSATFNRLNVCDTSSIACHRAFMFQLIAKAGAGFDLDIISLQGNTKFSCVSAVYETKIENTSIYVNYLYSMTFDGGSIASFMNSFEENHKLIYTKLSISCVDSLVLCSMYGLKAQCRFLLSKAVPCSDRKAAGFFNDAFGNWVPIQVALFRDWSKLDETASWSPINIATHRGHREILELLLCHGHDCNTRSPLGWTPLTLACFNGEEDIVDLLLKHGVLASRPDATGWTPVMVCVAKLGLRRIRYDVEITGEWTIEGARDRLCYHVAKGISNQIVQESKRAALAMSMFDQPTDSAPVTKETNTSIINKLLQKCNVSAECSPNGWSALYTSVCLQQHSVSKSLMLSKADVNVGCLDGRQPLFAACSIPHVPLVVHLLKLGANPNPAVPKWRSKLALLSVLTKEGTGPLIAQYQCVPIVAACKAGSLSTLLALLSACQEMSNFPDFETVNAATSACIESISMHVLGMLLVHPVTRKHAIGSIAETFQGTCLLSLMLWAADTCQLWALVAAVAYGGDANGTKNGTSSLHIACSKPEAFKSAMYLVEQGADLYLRDAFSRTAYQICLQTQGLQAAGLLQEAFELKGQKGSQKSQLGSKPESRQKLMFPSSLEACSRAVHSIAAALNSSNAEGASELFEAHAAEPYDGESQSDEDCFMMDDTLSRMSVASPHRNFKLDSSHAILEQSFHQNGRIMPFSERGLSSTVLSSRPSVAQTPTLGAWPSSPVWLASRPSIQTSPAGAPTKVTTPRSKSFRDIVKATIFDNIENPASLLSQLKQEPVVRTGRYEYKSSKNVRK